MQFNLLSKDMIDSNRIKFIELLLEFLEDNKLSKELLPMISKNCGFEINYEEVLFPSGMTEIVDTLNDYQDDKMLKYLSSISTPDGIRAKIFQALSFRIKMLSQGVYLNLGKYYCLSPLDFASSTKNIWKTSDLIWKYAGDTSDDFNYYTKRTLLSGVYCSSVLFYMTDKSLNFDATDRFIKNALDGVVNLGKFMSSLCSVK
jgi:ubiquinone biosynthesis protein COQ9